MVKKPTIKDVAKLAGSSITTVSRVLNNDKSLSVADETRKRIFEVADKLDYKTLKQKNKSCWLFGAIDDWPCKQMRQNGWEHF